jgi:transcriptional regulator with PAS, ATPase and Fis domain
MSPVMQVKLLRVLQERRFRRVGGLEEQQANGVVTRRIRISPS